MVEPTWVVENDMLVGLAANWPGVVGALAVPLKLTPRDGFDASETRVNVPEDVPLVVGAKVTLNDMLCPAAKVAGSDRPLTLNAADETPACVMFTLVPPLFFTVWT